MELDQKAFAALMGRTADTVGRWERGVTRPSYEDMVRLEGYGLTDPADVRGILAATGRLLAQGETPPYSEMIEMFGRLAESLARHELSDDDRDTLNGFLALLDSEVEELAEQRRRTEHVRRSIQDLLGR